MGPPGPITQMAPQTTAKPPPERKRSYDTNAQPAQPKRKKKKKSMPENIRILGPPKYREADRKLFCQMLQEDPDQLRCRIAYGALVNPNFSCKEMNRYFFNVFGAKAQELCQLFDCNGMAEIASKIREGYELPATSDQPQQQEKPAAYTPMESSTDEAKTWYAMPLAAPAADQKLASCATMVPNTVNTSDKMKRTSAKEDSMEKKKIKHQLGSTSHKTPEKSKNQRESTKLDPYHTKAP